jgi:hypothetical protein
MRNPHYHSFSHSIPGIWYRRRSCVWKISQHRIQRLTSHTVHLMTLVCAPAGLVFFFLPFTSVVGLNSLSAYLCSWQTLLNRFPRGTTGMWFMLVLRRTFIRPRVGERAILSICGALFLEAGRLYSLEFQEETSSLANLRPGPSAYIRLPCSSHDATTEQ